MDRKKFLAERQWIRSQLANVADFWITNGWDKEHGGDLGHNDHQRVVRAKQISEHGNSLRKEHLYHCNTEE